MSDCPIRQLTHPLVISPVSDFNRSHLATHQPNTLRLHRQSSHKFFKAGAVSLSQRCFQCMTKRTFQAALPTFTPVVQIGASTGKFTGWVDLHSASSSNKPNHLPFGQNFPAAHA